MTGKVPAVRRTPTVRRRATRAERNILDLSKPCEVFIFLLFYSCWLLFDALAGLTFRRFAWSWCRRRWATDAVCFNSLLRLGPSSSEPYTPDTRSNPAVHLARCGDRRRCLNRCFPRLPWTGVLRVALVSCNSGLCYRQNGEQRCDHCSHVFRFIVGVSSFSRRKAHSPILSPGGMFLFPTNTSSHRSLTQGAPGAPYFVDECSGIILAVLR